MMALNGEVCSEFLTQAQVTLPENSFYWEESLVKLTGAAEDLKSFKQHCETLRDSVCKAWDCKKSGSKVDSSTFATSLLAIKELNRRAQFRIKKARERTTEQKLAVDKLHLDLQNVQYEVVHLENEINTCLEFKSQHEKLKLIPVPEFCQATDCSESSVATHEGTLKRLYWELEQRKQVSTSLDQLQRSVEAASQKLQQKRDYLSSFGPKLKELTEYTLPFQKLIDVPFAREEDQYKRAALLSPPLYMLYAYLKSYVSSSGRTDVTLSIDGDVELVNTTTQLQPDSLNPSTAAVDDDDSDADVELLACDDADESGKRKSSSKPKSVSVHPLSVVVNLIRTIKLTDEMPEVKLKLRLVFLWVLDLHLVTVQSELSVLDDSFPLRCSSGSDLLRSDQLLAQLNWNLDGVDTSLDHPLPSDQYQSIGQPFGWAQQLCGLHCLPEQEMATPRASPSQLDRIGSWLNAVEQRLSNRLSLILELSEIEQKRLHLLPAQRALLPNGCAQGTCPRLTAWLRSDFDQIKLVQRAHLPISLNLLQASDAIFRCEFSRTDLYSASAVIALPLDYPRQAPLIIIDRISSARGTKVDSATSELTDLHLQNLEAEVNCFWSEFFPDPPGVQNNKNILSCQLARLMCCLDMLYSARKSGATDSGDLLLPLRNPAVKFPTRTCPLHYLPTLGAFIYR